MRRANSPSPPPGDAQGPRQLLRTSRAFRTTTVHDPGPGPRPPRGRKTARTGAAAVLRRCTLGLATPPVLPWAGCWGAPACTHPPWLLSRRLLDGGHRPRPNVELASLEPARYRTLLGLCCSLDWRRWSLGLGRRSAHQQFEGTARFRKPTRGEAPWWPRPWLADSTLLQPVLQRFRHVVCIHIARAVEIGERACVSLRVR